MVFDSSLDMGILFKKAFFLRYRKENQQKPFTNYASTVGDLTLVWIRELSVTQVWNGVLV